MRSNLRTTLLAWLALLAALPAQSGPTPLPADLEALAARVDKTHHPEGKGEAITKFSAALEVHLLAAEQEQGGQVDLRVRYMRSVSDTKKTRHYIRYRVLRAGRPIERGRDRYGFWHLFQGKARDLTEADVEDRTACRRDTMLARQLVRFLDPGQVMRSLTNPTAVKQEPFEVGRLAAVPCETVEGSLAEFPLLRLAGGDRPVRLKFFVRKADGRLHAVLVRPERNGEAVEQGAEQIRLDNYQLSDGVLIPKKLEHSFRDEQDKMRLHSRVFLTKVDLRPEFALEDFDRPPK